MVWMGKVTVVRCVGAGGLDRDTMNYLFDTTRIVAALLGYKQTGKLGKSTETEVYLNCFFVLK
jgi:hypothetical protein